MSVICKICKGVLKYNKSPSALHTHLKKHLLALTEEQCKSPQQSISDFAKHPILTEKRQQQITNLLVNFIVKDIQSLAALHREGFKEIVHYFEPGYKLPSYNTTWNTIKHQYDSLR